VERARSSEVDTETFDGLELGLRDDCEALRRNLGSRLSSLAFLLKLNGF
jgi:hypothetical protein